MTKVNFAYFAITGRYHNDSDGVLFESPSMLRDEVRKMRASSLLPGVEEPASFIIVVTPLDDASIDPFLLLPEGM